MLDNQYFNVTGPNNIDLDFNFAQVQFKMPKERFVLGNNLIKLAWGVFPSSMSGDVAYVRGSPQPQVMYNAFTFYDLYDWDFSLWMGIIMLVTS